MAQRAKSRSEGSHFGVCMLGIVVFLVLLMWYFKSNEDSQYLPQRPPGISSQF